jgi:hypothetical protein
MENPGLSLFHPGLSLQVDAVNQQVRFVVWCGVAMWLVRRAAVRQPRVRILPGTPPLVQLRKIKAQESNGANFSQRSSRRYQRSSRQPVTKDE